MRHFSNADRRELEARAAALEATRARTAAMQAVELEGAQRAAAVAWEAYARLEAALLVIEAGLPPGHSGPDFDGMWASMVARNALNAALVNDPGTSLTKRVDD